MPKDLKPSSRVIFKPLDLQLFKGVDILKLKQIAVAMMLVLPFASAQSAESVDPNDFNALVVKMDAMQDSMEVSGLKGLRISGGMDPVYFYNHNAGTSSFAFLNNFSNINGSGEFYSYDNSYFGMAYLDIQKEMDDGSKMRLTLAPSKSTGAQYNFGNIVHEASVTIPIDGPATRLMAGQMPDVSGYEPFLNGFSGTNAITSNQLYPGFPEYFITKNMLFDFAAATFYTGVGLDMVRGPWEVKLFLANFNSARNQCTSTGTTGATPPVAAGNGTCAGTNTTPTFIYNATYAQEEYWGYEFTGYEGSVSNWNAGGASRLDNFEIDAWYTRGDFNTNLQYTIGRQANAANSLDGNNNTQDAGWWGVSGLVSERVTPKLTFAGRIDYLNNQRNGGGTFNTYNSNPFNTTLAATGAVGDSINGFGPGDPNAAGYDPQVGANRTSFTVAATYRLTRYAALRAELRHDISTLPSFYRFTDGVFTNSNDTAGLQTIVNF